MARNCKKRNPARLSPAECCRSMRAKYGLALRIRLSDYNLKDNDACSTFPSHCRNSFEWQWLRVSDVRTAGKNDYERTSRGRNVFAGVGSVKLTERGGTLRELRPGNRQTLRRTVMVRIRNFRSTCQAIPDDRFHNPPVS